MPVSKSTAIKMAINVLAETAAYKNYAPTVEKVTDYILRSQGYNLANDSEFQEKIKTAIKSRWCSQVPAITPDQGKAKEETPNLYASVPLEDLVKKYEEVRIEVNRLYDDCDALAKEIAIRRQVIKEKLDELDEKFGD